MEKKILDKLDSFDFSLQQKRMLVEVIKDIIVSTKSDVPAVQSDPLLPLFEAAGATYIPETDTYTVNGVNGITKDEMPNMYSDAILSNIKSKKNYKINMALNPALLSINKFYTQNGLHYAEGRNFSGSMINSETLVIYDENYIFKISPFKSEEVNCIFSKNVKKIVNVIDFSNITTNPIFLYYPFGFCTNLETVYIKNLKSHLLLSASQNLSAESIKYLIQNATNSEEIVVYVPINIMNKINSNIEEWNGILESATNKKIRFSDLYGTLS